MTENLLAVYRRAADLAVGIVERVHPDQLGDATPCTEWNVRMLINHVVIGNLFFVHLATGSPPRFLPRVFRRPAQSVQRAARCTRNRCSGTLPANRAASRYVAARADAIPRLFEQVGALRAVSLTP
jgi:Mycothiol maleylpyruvate isomerase N-terminal domain